MIKQKPLLQRKLINEKQQSKDNWKEMKSREFIVGEFDIPDNNPSLEALADEYIERYGK